MAMNFQKNNLLAKEYEPIEQVLLGMNEPMEQKIEAMDVEYMQSLFPMPEKNWDEEIKTGKAKIFVYRPDEKTEGRMPLIYFTHGGGDISGHANQSNLEMKRMANIHHAVVVTVEYRLATETSFPAAINDIYEGLKYCFEHAEELSVDTNHVVIMGESFGGGATAALALYNRAHDNYPISGEVLIYPMLDYRSGSDDTLYHNPFVGEVGWTRRMNHLSWEAYRAGQDITPNDMPYFSAATAGNLEGMPETFILVGSLDLFLDEDICFAHRLIKNGVGTELHVIPGVMHCFDMLVPEAPQTKQYKDLRFNAIERMLKK